MLKILIIDDEYYFRQALKISIPWEEVGFEIVGEAKNGEDGLNKLGELQPDIVLVDINMPIMDGLEFVHHAKLGGSSSKFIILSGQSEFSYAKQAVQLGVFNYIQKPIDEEELLRTLLEVKELIVSELNVKLELDDLKQQAKAYLPVLKDRFLNDWLQGNIQINHADNRDRFAYLGIDLKAPAFSIFAIDIDPKLDRMWNENDKHIWKFAVSNIATDFIQEKYKLATCYDSDERLIFILGAEISAFDKIEAVCEAIRNAVETYLKFTITIGIGNVYPDLESVPVSYKEAIYAIKNRFVLGDNRVIVHATIAESGMTRRIFAAEQRNQLLMSMRIGNISETEKWLNDFFAWIYKSKAISVEMLFVAGVEMVATCMEYIAETTQKFDEVFKESSQFDLLGLIQQMSSIHQMESWTHDVIRKAMTHVQNNKQSKTTEIVENVKAYIELNYGNEELRIDDISRHVFLNYSHLCYVFKKETAITINDYLTEVRILKAKALFAQGERIVQTVAAKVGYADANYFGKCFKKYVGLTPSKYVENIRI